MNKKTADTGRPNNVSDLWDQIFDNLPGAFWTQKGLSGTCPFCHAESSPSKQKFLIRFEEGQFKSFSCFVCQASGGNTRGIHRLCRQMGVAINAFDAGALTGQGEEFYRPQLDGDEGEGEVGPVDWPPFWLKSSEEVRRRGIEYMEKRGILDVPRIVEKYELLFSEVVEMTTASGDKVLRPYPCVVAPMVSIDGEIIGWTTRRLGESSDPNDPKSIALTGRGWKTQSLFGIREVDPRKPVTIVEGVFSALSTPNSVAIGGKAIDMQQVSILADSRAKVFVFALDPEVEKRAFANVMYRLHLESPGSKVFPVEWKEFGGYFGRDPNDRGWQEMAQIITKTVRDHMNSD